MKTSTLSLIAGVLAVIGGLMALFVPLPASLAVVAFTAAFFLISGIAGLYAAFSNEALPRRGWVGVFGALQLLLGVWMLAQPLTALVSLTIVAATSFLIGGIGRIYYAFALRDQSQMAGAFWMLILSGLVSVGLGVYVLINFAASVPVLLGILFGVELISIGVALMSFGLALRNQSDTKA